LVFTGGGTESDNLALQGAALAGGRRGGVVTLATEHEAVLETAEFLGRLGCQVTITGVDRLGRVNPETMATAITTDTAVVSVMAANNETGTIQPVAAVAEAARTRHSEVMVHTDAVQAFISEEVTVDILGVDLLTLAAHKFGGPKGVGLLYVRDGLALEPLLHGGGQELGRRSGTQNVAGAVGMATAMELAAQDRPRFRSDVAEARRRFEAKLTGVAERTVPEEISLVQHSHLRFAHHPSETLLVNLDLGGVAASAGSACQSGATQTSHVLKAMGMTDEEAQRCLRFSFGWNTTADEADAAAEIVIAACEQLR
jgi:cysteine desulfurase